MKGCRILSIKTIPNMVFQNHKTKIIDYSENLTEKIKNQRGFLGAETFWIHNIHQDFPSHTQIVTISNWKNYTEWNNWYESKDRQLIMKNHSLINKKEQYYKIKNKKPNDNLFLL